MTYVGVVTNGRNIQIHLMKVANSKLKHYGNNICTLADEKTPSHTVLFLHSQHLTHDMRCKQTDGRSEAKEVDSGTHATYPHRSPHHFRRCFLVAVVCLSAGC